MKYTKEKKSMQHISGLWGTSLIYIDISTFLEKLFKVILFLIIPIDKIPRQLFFTFCPTLRGHFFETALKVQTQILIALCSIYTQLCMIIKNRNYFFFYVVRQILSNLCWKDSQTQSWGWWRRERSDKRHTKRLRTHGMFSAQAKWQLVANRHTASYVPFAEAYTDLIHCEINSNVYFPFVNCLMQNCVLHP